jgi:4-diphosphocytidyl-2-C-methyl-D-erythritol kinase
LQKREDGFHDLETVFYPIPLVDALEIIPANETNISVSGIKIDTAEEDNICIKAYHLLKKDFVLPPVKIHLHKNIPIGAGLGGGSADGAFTLLLLNKKFNLNLSGEELNSYALTLGSDCPFFIKNKPCLASKQGEILQEIDLDLSGYKLVLVNPYIHIYTGWAFSQIEPNKNRTSLFNIIQQPIQKWKGILVNDFEEAIFNHYPAVKEIKEQLYREGAMYAAMSGSGSTVFGLFNNNKIPPLTFPKYFVQWVM